MVTYAAETDGRNLVKKTGAAAPGMPGKMSFAAEASGVATTRKATCRTYDVATRKQLRAFRSFNGQSF